MRWKTLAVVALTLSSVIPSYAAQGRGRGRGRGGDDNSQGQNETARHGTVIGDRDQRMIRECFAKPENLRGLPPGLAKKEKLPPGLQKQLVRNGQLPPGLQKKIQPVPPVLERQLTPVPEGCKRVVISGSIVLLNQRKNLILDVFAAW